MTRTRTSIRFQSLSLLVLMACCVGCDQVTKHYATQQLAEATPISFWQDTFRLQFALNPGGFLGLGGDWSPEVRAAFFIGLNGLGLTALAAYLWVVARTNWPLGTACALILAGGIGNQIDRCLWGGLVIDFMNIGIGPIRSGIFNVADVAISVGALWWMWLVFRKSPQTNPQ